MECENPDCKNQFERLNNGEYTEVKLENVCNDCIEKAGVCEVCGGKGELSDYGFTSRCEKCSGSGKFFTWRRSRIVLNAEEAFKLSVCNRVRIMEISIESVTIEVFKILKQPFYAITMTWKMIGTTHTQYVSAKRELQW